MTTVSPSCISSINSTENFEWRVATEPVPYPDALAEMEKRVALIECGEAPELFWLLEHPPLYTAGTSATPADLVDPDRFPVFETGRGGKYTYHGPGQRVVYALRDLRNHGRDMRAHVCHLEEWVIRTLAEFGITGERRDGRIGIWVPPGDKTNTPLPPAGGAGGGLVNTVNISPPFIPPASKGETQGTEEKIAAIGVRVRRWVTFHGLALNVNPDLSHFSGIVPCGLGQYGVTSLHKLGVKASMAEIDAALRRAGEGLIF